MVAYLFIYICRSFIHTSWMISIRWYVILNLPFQSTSPFFPSLLISRSGEAISWKSVVNPCIWLAWLVATRCHGLLTGFLWKRTYSLHLPGTGLSRWVFLNPEGGMIWHDRVVFCKDKGRVFQNPSITVIHHVGWLEFLLFMYCRSFHLSPDFRCCSWQPAVWWWWFCCQQSHSCYVAHWQHVRSDETPWRLPIVEGIISCAEFL